MTYRYISLKGSVLNTRALAQAVSVETAISPASGPFGCGLKSKAITSVGISRPKNFRLSIRMRESSMRQRVISPERAGLCADRALRIALFIRRVICALMGILF